MTLILEAGLVMSIVAQAILTISYLSGSSAKSNLIIVKFVNANIGLSLCNLYQQLTATSDYLHCREYLRFR